MLSTLTSSRPRPSTRSDPPTQRTALPKEGEKTHKNKKRGENIAAPPPPYSLSFILNVKIFINGLLTTRLDYYRSPQRPSSVLHIIWFSITWYTSTTSSKVPPLMGQYSLLWMCQLYSFLFYSELFVLFCSSSHFLIYVKYMRCINWSMISWYFHYVEYQKSDGIMKVFCHHLNPKLMFSDCVFCQRSKVNTKILLELTSFKTAELYWLTNWNQRSLCISD